jgi:hypothetical protein
MLRVMQRHLPWCVRSLRLGNVLVVYGRNLATLSTCRAAACNDAHRALLPSVRAFPTTTSRSRALPDPAHSASLHQQNVCTGQNDSGDWTWMDENLF